MNGVTFTLSHPISIDVFIYAISFLILVKKVIFSSKASKSGLLVSTPSRILKAIHLKVSSSISSPSSLIVT